MAYHYLRMLCLHLTELVELVEVMGESVATVTRIKRFAVLCSEVVVLATVLKKCWAEYWTEKQSAFAIVSE